MALSITGAEVAKIRADLEKKGQLQVASALFQSNASRQLQQNLASIQAQRNQPPQAQDMSARLKAALAKVKGVSKEVGKAIIRPTQDIFKSASQAGLARQMPSIVESNQAYVNSLINRSRMTSDPEKRRALLEQAMKAGRIQEFEGVGHLTGGSTRKDISDLGQTILLAATPLSVAGSAPMAGARAFQLSKAAQMSRAAQYGLAAGEGAAFSVAHKGLEKYGQGERLTGREAVTAAGFGAVAAPVAMAGMSLIGRLASRAFTARGQGAKAIEQARDIATKRGAAVQKEQSFLKSLKTGQVTTRNMNKSQYKQAYSTQRSLESVRKEIAAEVHQAKQAAVKATKAGDTQTAKIASTQAADLTKELSKITDDVARLRKLTGVRTSEFLREAPKARKIEFKQTAKGEGVKVPIKVKETVPVIRAKGHIERISSEPPSIKVDEVYGLRRALDPSDEAAYKTFTELDVAEAGKRHFTPDGEVIGQKSSFPDWLPEHLRTSNLIRQFNDLTSKKQLPSARQGKLREMFATVENEINRKAGIDIQFEPEDFIPQKVPKNQPPKFDVVEEFGEETITKKVVGGKGGKEPEFTGTVKEEPRTAGAPVERTADLAGGTEKALEPQQVSSLLKTGQKATVSKTVSRTGEKVSASNVNVPKAAPKAQDIQSSTKKVLAALKKAAPLRGKQEAIYHAEHARRSGASAAAAERASGEGRHIARLEKIKGEMPKVEFEALRKSVSQADIDNLFEGIHINQTLLEYEKVAAGNGLRKMLEGGLPTNSEIRLLEEVFGGEFVLEVLAKRSAFAKFLELQADVISVPRAIMASADFSGGLRQGLVLGAHSPLKGTRAFFAALKGTFSDKAFRASQQAIKERPTYKIMREAELALTEMGGDLTKREEKFMSTLAERIPGAGWIVKASNRHMTGFLNRFRADVFDSLYKAAFDEGVIAERPQVIDSISKFINSASGRGSLAKGDFLPRIDLENSAAVLSTALFSPRLLASRVNMLNPAFYMRLDPFARKHALRSMFTMVTAGTTVVGLAKAAGADVETDPRSSDFMKIKFGNTRYDIWGGFQQYPVLAARLATGEMISTTTGRKHVLGEGFRPITRLDILSRFFTFKTAPVPSLALDMVRGQTAIGDDFELDVEVANRFIPMVAQDMHDLYKERGTAGIPMALPVTIGIGVQTYGRRETDISTDEDGKVQVSRPNVSGLGEDIVNWIKQTPPDEATRHLDTYEQVQAHVKSGNTSAASRMVGEMSKGDYEVYKKIKNEFQKEEIIEVRESVRPKLMQIQSLLEGGNTIDARQVLDNMSDAEYKAYKELKKEEGLDFESLQ